MSKRIPSDQAIKAKRIANDVKVIRHVLENLETLATGKLESAQKLMTFYAGYTAIRSLWDAKTRGGKVPIADPKLNAEMQRRGGKFIFRVDVEISHSIGEDTNTLLRVVTLRYWSRKALMLWG